MHASTVYLFLLSLLIFPMNAWAQQEDACSVNDISCISAQINDIANTIEQSRWRDYAYRDLAVSTAYQGEIDDAVAILNQIENPDTKAMTIRAIGMALALHKDLSDESYKSVFSKLDKAAAAMTNEGARDIAYTYIAMAQAFAGLDADATATTNAMVKPELKSKAFAETAEIQAERGDYDAAIKSINNINLKSFKNKGLSKIVDIFVKDEKYDLAYKTAQQITNPTQKAVALQKIVNAQLGLDSYDKK